MKHLIVPQKSTFQRFAKQAHVKVLGTYHKHYCDGSKRGTFQGKNYRHPPLLMHRSGTAPSGDHRILRYECPCGFKTTFGKSG